MKRTAPRKGTKQNVAASPKRGAGRGFTVAATSDAPRWFSPSRLWLAAFAIWAIFLTGALAPFGGGPGVIQGLRLHALLESKRAQKTEIEAEIERVQLEAERLEHSRVAQEREIRRVLGYTAPDEIIFDFSASERDGDTRLSSL